MYKRQAQKSDTPLLDNNVSIGALKNLVTDKPAPITLKLAQKSDTPLLDNNVSIGALKNLVTDKPAPITLKLAQFEKDDKMKSLVSKNTTGNATANATVLAQGVPVHVNPVLMKDTMGDAKLDMKILVGPDELELQKKKAAEAAKKQLLGQKEGVPVHVNPVLMKDQMADANLGLNMRVGPDEVSVEKKK